MDCWWRYGVWVRDFIFAMVTVQTVFYACAKFQLSQCTVLWDALVEEKEADK